MSDPKPKVTALVYANGAMPEELRELLELPYGWFVVRDGRMAMAGSEVCNSVAHETAERVAKLVARREG